MPRVYYYWMKLSDDQKNAENPDQQTKDVLDYLHTENDYTKGKLKHTEAFQEKLFNEIVGRIICAHLGVGYELDTLLGHEVNPALDHLLGEFHVGDTVG